MTLPNATRSAIAPAVSGAAPSRTLAKAPAKPILAVLAGHRVDPAPVWLMRQAGRWLPEYREIRAKAANFLEFALTPDLATEATLQPLRRLGVDAAILFSDILIVPHALGADVRFVEGEGPRIRPVLDPKGFDPANAAERAAPVMETVRRVRAGLPDGATLIGFAGAPFTVACYVIDGQGGGEFPATRALLHGDPARFTAILAAIEAATVEYLVAQSEAGAEALMLFDSWAGLLDPRSFARFVTAPAARIANALALRCPGIPLIGFPRMAGTNLLAYGLGAGVAAVALDTGVDPTAVDVLLPAGLPVQGNLDPLVLRAGGPALQAEALAIRRGFSGRPHIFNLGHGVLPDTPPEHGAALMQALRAPL